MDRLTMRGFADLLQVLLDQDGALQSTAGGLSLRSLRPVLIPLWRCGAFLLLDADEHLGEEVALEFLPGLSILAHANGAVEP